MKKVKTEKKGLSMREKLLARKKELEKKGSGGGMIYPKEGTIRFRIKDPGEDCELAIEIIQFYLGPKIRWSNLSSYLQRRLPIHGEIPGTKGK